MSKSIRYTDEFKRDAVAQVKERGYSVKDVSERLGSFIIMSQNRRARMRASTINFKQKGKDQKADYRTSALAIPQGHSLISTNKGEQALS